MSDVVIEANNVSKLYRLGELGTGTISHDLNRWWASLRGKEDPFSKVGEMNDRTQKAKKGEYAWALRDIDFEVKQGDVMGIIGKNGAGKSTLLKLLSRITAPTTGEIKIKGRVASLLEVGTGMHPEMTGRENVYLNGTILGMTRKEITNKLDEILDFAGCLKYADTPVKRYSSGMKVRLGFAVAAFLEPEILIVDEVLAVGDAEFQKKAIGKMQDISHGQGRTVLFVSHNMGAVSKICTRGIVLGNGEVVVNGDVTKCLAHYLGDENLKSNVNFVNKDPMENDILSIRILKSNMTESSTFFSDEEIKIEIVAYVTTKYRHAYIGFRLMDQLGRNVFTSQEKVEKYFLNENQVTMTASIPAKLLVPNIYIPVVGYHLPNQEIIRIFDDKVRFEIEESGTEYYQSKGLDYGCVFVDCKWS